MTNELQWGHTPWDNLSRDELVREVERMYSALVSLYSIVNSQKEVDKRRAGSDLYWGKQGAGGAAWEKGRQIIEPLRKKYQDGIYRAFGRYADDLLFENNGYDMVGSGWLVCDTCGTMIGRAVNQEPYADLGKPCRHGRKDCTGTYRKLIWSDLAPNVSEKVESE